MLMQVEFSLRQRDGIGETQLFVDTAFHFPCRNGLANTVQEAHTTVIESPVPTSALTNIANRWQASR